MRIAVDAMGGDRAPGEVIKGALDAVRRFEDIEIVLAGVQDRIAPLLPEGAPDRVSILHCRDVVEMDESPVDAIRRKKDSSLRRIFELAAAGKVDAVVSAGNTGATVAAATMLVKPLEVCRRPGIAASLPSTHGHTIVIDVGANIACRPIHLLQYAVMAQVFAREILGVAQPSIGIMNVGAEARKGNDLARAAWGLLDAHVSGFIGNVEGRDIFNGTVDVIVCDGFVGNVMLKAVEGYSSHLVSTLVENFANNLPQGHHNMKKDIGEFVARNDYREYGGAPLLGVEVPVIISHGSSNSTAITNAVRVARDFTARHVNNLIVDALREADSAADREVE